MTTDFAAWLDNRADACLSIANDYPEVCPAKDMWIARATVYHEVLQEWRKWNERNSIGHSTKA